MQHGEHHFKSTLAFVWPRGIRINGDAATVIHYFACTIVVQRDRYLVAKARHCFVYGVVDNFPNEVVQASQTRRADIHTRTTTHRVKTLKHLDVLGAVGASGLANRAFCGVTGAIYCHVLPCHWCGLEMHK